METIKLLLDWILWIVPVAKEHFSGSKLSKQREQKVVSFFNFGFASILVFLVTIFSDELTKPWKVVVCFLCFVSYLFIGFFFEDGEDQKEENSA